ncbi:hypothetical protein HMPREF9370_0365 [Neisseria wadsworthii 9715]|uniref:Uncharacterized protein n=1 Tax=Neisseria wadsworthii 9715 TaxID=1030841 RepID=G4CMQ6_9NEIS|nr:hypothetical protein HMPREF9370_0365 [Neisseria wadsworthii 9715]
MVIPPTKANACPQKLSKAYKNQKTAHINLLFQTGISLNHSKRKEKHDGKENLGSLRN